MNKLNILSNRINILDYCTNIFYESDEDFGNLIKQFGNYFTIKNYSFEEIYNLRTSHYRIEHLSFKIKDIHHKIISRNLESIRDVKKSISYRTKWPIEQIYFINTKGNENPKDEDSYLYDYDIVFVLNTDHIEISEDVLGHGSFGDVRLCRDKLSNEQFVLKIPRHSEKDLARDIIILHRFKSSNYLLGYSNLYSFNGRTCLAMKYLSGGPLDSYLEKNKVTEQQIAKWCHQILKQINEMHKKKIIHRDIRSDNIVLDENTNVYLIDFGIAKSIDNLLSDNMMKNIRMSRRGSEVYMALEMINGEYCSNKIDIWSFGVTVIEMVLRERPYKNLLPIQALVRIAKIKKVEYEPSEPISKELEAFINSCLNPNSNERLSAKQLIKSQFISFHLNNYSSSFYN